MPGTLRSRLLRGAALLGAALVVPLAAPPAASAADDLAALRSQARAATARLLDGTRRLETERRDLEAVQARAVTARRAAASAQVAVAGSRARLDAVVAAAWRDPVPDTLLLALGAGSSGLRDTLAAHADLDHVRGSTAQVVDRATADRVRATALLDRATALERDARRRERAVAREVEGLRGLADRTGRRLQAAAARVALAGRASRYALRGDASGGDCTGASFGGAPNGFLPDAALCPIGGGGRLRADAARAFLRMAAAHPLCLTDSYRDYASQVAVFRTRPGLAAVPGTSNHGWGVAVDLGCGAERFDSDAFRWLSANAGRYGWHHPAWAEPGGVTPEPWHWEFTG